MIALLIIFTLLQLLDAWTTHKIIGSGGREMNPLLDRLFQKMGHIPGLLLTKGLLLALVWIAMLVFIPGWWWLVVALCVVYAVVVGHNLIQMREK